MTDTKPLTRADLDPLGCETPGCDHTAHDGLVLHSNCHPETPTWTSYHANSGTIHVECAQCGHRILAIAVAPGPEREPHVIAVPLALDEPVVGYEACWAESGGLHCRKPKHHDGDHAYI